MALGYRITSVFVRTLLVFLCLVLPAFATDIHIAVASNFKPAMERLVTAYENQSEYQVLVSASSTGKHYAQILNGAPFDLYFSADVERPAALEAKGIGVAGSRFSYAIGKLVV